MTSERQFRFRVALAFGLVYVFWGSTYLGIRIAVEHIPPELMTGTRFPIAGIITLTACLLTGRSIAITRRQFLQQAIVGALLLSVCNTTLAWAEQYIRTGLASLLVASIPIWILVINTWILRGERLAARGLIGLGLSLSEILESSEVLVLGSSAEFSKPRKPRLNNCVYPRQ